MPWPTGKGFAGKHNKKLTGAAAQKAADQATALVNKGMDEGEAIRIANKTGDRLLAKESIRHAAASPWKTLYKKDK